MNRITFNGKNVCPSKVVCIGRNYAAHIHELNNATPDSPVVFIKPNSAIANRLCTDLQESIHYEGEITFIVQAGKIAGVGFGLDLTKRTIQAELKAKGLPWERAKAFDGSAVFSDFLPINSELETLAIELSINGRLVQQGCVADMLFKPASLLAEIQTFITLADNDLLMTGTPKGVGVVKVGDQFHGRILLRDQVIIEHKWQAVLN